MKKLLSLLFSIGLIIIFVAFGLPFLQNLYPKKFTDEIEKRDIEASALFYTESEEAMDAHFLMEKKHP